MSYQNAIGVIRRSYHKLPIPVKYKKYLSVAVRHSLFAKIIKIIRNKIRRHSFSIPFEFKRPLSAFAAEDYIFYGVIDWHFRHQRPQHLALNIAKTGRRVFYISPSFNICGDPGFTYEKVSNDQEVYQLRLNMLTRDVIYGEELNDEEVKFLNESLGKFCFWAGIENAISIIQHPIWGRAVLMIPIFTLNIYDCMDHHDGFSNDEKSLVKIEQNLFSAVDLVITTSDFLDAKAKKNSTRTRLIRNGVEYEHFSQVFSEDSSDAFKGKRIGYYGAVAEWFDDELLFYLATKLPNNKFLIVGSDTAGVAQKFLRFKNVKFFGEKKYSDLPRFLNQVDICLLPFKVNELTSATNPLKIYEYLAAGKAVVATSLPECGQFADLIKCASSKEEFLSCISSLDGADSLLEVLRRQKFAEQNSWKHRVEKLLFEIHEVAIEKNKSNLISLIVVTYNNLCLTKECILSIQKNLNQSSYEIIVVDNCSNDGTQNFLTQLSLGSENVKIILNNDNKGFAAANNQGLEIANGKYLVLLNNDTYISSDSMMKMANHLMNNPNIGLIGPVTNNIGNEAKIEIQYDDMIGMQLESKKYMYANFGRLQNLKNLAFYCVMMPREVYKIVGKLDEAFGLGFFEDDDYCRRVQKAGFLTVCAHDVYVHHHLSASFGKLKNDDRTTLFNRNKKLYEDKWGTWSPHVHSSSKAKSLTGEEKLFNGFKKISGQCNICGMQSFFYYESVEMFRETLFCGYCKSTSRYRSIAKAILEIFDKNYGVMATSLNKVNGYGFKQKIKIFDTQQPFHFITCAYVLPDYLRRIHSIEVTTSKYEPSHQLGFLYPNGVENQNLEHLTFGDDSFDIVITSDVMEHVRLDNLAHEEIYRVLKKGGHYIFNVPHSMELENDLIRVEIIDSDDPLKDKQILEPEYHGDVNGSGEGALSYRVYGRSILKRLKKIGFNVSYQKNDSEDSGILNTEIFICKK
jgi:GT2 family glycosyltransferase/glycosyltransferase involved in cell wall biosynthesis/SAM-dependent methyltransferase